MEDERNDPKRPRIGADNESARSTESRPPNPRVARGHARLPSAEESAWIVPAVVNEPPEVVQPAELSDLYPTPMDVLPTALGEDFAPVLVPARVDYERVEVRTRSSDLVPSVSTLVMDDVMTKDRVSLSALKTEPSTSSVRFTSCESEPTSLALQDLMQDTGAVDLPCSSVCNPGPDDNAAYQDSKTLFSSCDEAASSNLLMDFGEGSSVLTEADYVEYRDKNDFFACTSVDDDVFYDANEFVDHHEHHREDEFNDADIFLRPEDDIDASQASTSSDQPPPAPTQPLYSGAKVTVSEISIAFLSLILNNNISGQLLARLLSFIQLILPDENYFFSTLHSFFKKFEHIKSPLNFIFYCSACMRGLSSKDAECTRCGPNVQVNYYLNLSLIHSITSLYCNPTFVEALSYRFNRKKLVADNFEDVYDGYVYKSADSVLSDPLNISLFWNTDGMSLFKSSNFQVWPFYFIVNELPPNLRYKEEYMILAGLAFGNEKPAINLFLKPIWEEAEQLKRGFNVKLPTSDVPVNVKCIVLCGSCDAPAKSAFLRLTNFNGFYGCPRCLERGHYVLEEKVFVYPYEENVPLRTLDGYREHLNTWKTSGGQQPVFGLQGPTYLFNMVWPFFLTSTAVDVMHNVYLGVCRQLLFLWFSTPFLKRVFGEDAERKSLFEKLSTILCNMEAPHYLSRPPRSLSHLKFFKAAEFRTWLFSTSLPLLQNYMKEPFYGHYQRLVCAVSLLNQASVSNQAIVLAESQLLSFVREFQELYGLRHMSFNVHCLTHLADVTRALGPLWTSSCFGFESLNGKLARLVHGTRHAGLQIYSHLGLLRNLSPLTASLTNPRVKDFCKNMLLKSRPLNVVESVNGKYLIIGNIVTEHVLPPNFTDFLCRVTSIHSSLSFFFRLKVKEYLYVAEDYGKGSRNSSCVMYTSPDGHVKYGCVKVFVKVHCACTTQCEHFPSYMALVQDFQFTFPFCLTNPDAMITSILSIVLSDELQLIPVDSLLCVCFKMQVNKNLFLSVPLNQHELE